MVSEVKQLGFEVVHQHYLEVKALYPGLHEPYRKDNQIRIDGTIDIIDRNKSNWATYEIRIVCPENYPLRVPTLFETGGQIERSPEWHVNHKGSCCLAPPVKLYLKLADGITLKKWLEKFVIPFLANHVLKFKTGQYADVEYSHEGKGIREFYREWLGVSGNYKCRKSVNKDARFFASLISDYKDITF